MRQRKHDTHIEDKQNLKDDYIEPKKRENVKDRNNSSLHQVCPHATLSVRNFLKIFTNNLDTNSSSSLIEIHKSKSTNFYTINQLNELKEKDELPILLGIAGRIFDVSAGKKFYGKDSGYGHFAFRDASRAFVTGNFEGDGLTDNVSELEYEECQGIQQWLDFYINHKDYKEVGKLVGGSWYNEDGSPTAMFYDFYQNCLDQGDKKKDEIEYIKCNSKWSKSTGKVVWCTDSQEEGFFVPRRLVKTNKDAVEERCICMNIHDFRDNGEILQVYEGCSTTAHRCSIIPKDSKK